MATPSQPITQPETPDAPEYDGLQIDPSDNFLTKGAKAVGGFFSGIGEGLFSTAAGASDVADKVFGTTPGVVNKGLHTLAGDGQTRTTAESIGYGGETIAEFMLGDEALKGLSLAERMGTVSQWMGLAEKSPKLYQALHVGVSALKVASKLSPEEAALISRYPNIARAVTMGTDAARIGAVQAAQTAIRTGGDVEEAGKDAVLAAGMGAGFDAAGQIGKGARKLYGEEFEDAAKTPKVLQDFHEGNAGIADLFEHKKQLEAPVKPLLKDSDVEHWGGYFRNLSFKSEQEARERFFNKLEHEDRQSYAELFGKNGPEKNRAIADAIPVYKDGRNFKLGRKPGQGPVSTERLGTETPKGKAPNVNWSSRDLQDSGDKVTAESILQDYNSPRNRKAVAYKSYVPVGDLPDEALVEEAQDDFPGDEHSTYDWSDLKSRGTPPPIKVLVKPNGTSTILDGNHRTRFWREGGYDSVPAWVIDQRKGVASGAGDGRPLPAIDAKMGKQDSTRWFGKSQAVDEQGDPQLLYHGNTSRLVKHPGQLRKSFEAGDGIFLTSNPDVADTFTLPREYGESVFEDANGKEIKPGNTIPLYARIEKPLELTGEDAQKATDDTSYQVKVIKEAKAKGYDGVILRGVKEGIGERNHGDTYIVFDKDQIRFKNQVKLK